MLSPWKCMGHEQRCVVHPCGVTPVVLLSTLSSCLNGQKRSKLVHLVSRSSRRLELKNIGHSAGGILNSEASHSTRCPSTVRNLSTFKFWNLSTSLRGFPELPAARIIPVPTGIPRSLDQIFQVIPRKRNPLNLYIPGTAQNPATEPSKRNLLILPQPPEPGSNLSNASIPPVELSRVPVQKGSIPLALPERTSQTEHSTRQNFQKPKNQPNSAKRNHLDSIGALQNHLASSCF